MKHIFLISILILMTMSFLKKILCMQEKNSIYTCVDLYDEYCHDLSKVHAHLISKPWGALSHFYIKALQNQRNLLYKMAFPDAPSRYLAHFLNKHSAENMYTLAKHHSVWLQEQVAQGIFSYIDNKILLDKIKLIANMYNINFHSICYLYDNSDPYKIASAAHVILLGRKFVEEACYLEFAIGHEFMHIKNFDSFYECPFRRCGKNFVLKFHELRADMFACLGSLQYAYDAIQFFSHMPHEDLSYHHAPNLERARCATVLMNQMYSFIPSNNWLLYTIRILYVLPRHLYPLLKEIDDKRKMRSCHMNKEATCIPPWDQVICCVYIPLASLALFLTSRTVIKLTFVV